MSDTSMMTAPAAPIEPAAPNYNTPELFFGEVLKRSGLETFADVPTATLVSWEGPAGPLVLKVNESSPFVENDNVIAIFYDEDEIRVYAVPKGKGFLKRHALTRTSKTFVTERMPGIELFIDLLAAEYRDLATASMTLVTEDDLNEAVDAALEEAAAIARKFAAEGAAMEIESLMSDEDDDEDDKKDNADASLSSTS